MRIKANQELFDRWIALKEQIDLLAEIFQSEMEDTDGVLADWCRSRSKFLDELDILWKESVDYLIK
jgi:hypothetical protein